MRLNLRLLRSAGITLILSSSFALFMLYSFASKADECSKFSAVQDLANDSFAPELIQLEVNTIHSKAQADELRSCLRDLTAIKRSEAIYTTQGFETDEHNPLYLANALESRLAAIWD